MSLIGFLLLGLVPAQADVVIYKGVSRATGDINSATGLKNPLGAYLLVDYEARQVASILTYKIGRQKIYQVSDIASRNITTAQLIGGRVATILATGNSSETNADNFDHYISLFRGVNATLTLQNSPSLVQINRPNGLTGTVLYTQASSGAGRFFEVRTSLVFQSKATVQANNADKTLEQVRADLIADLEASGFVPPA